MKYMVRAEIYKAQNVTFSPKACRAYSYNWWLFVSKIGGKVVFNEYRYSVTTAKHQSKVRDLLMELGIHIDMTVQVPKGLQDVKTLKDLKALHKAEMIEQAEAKEQKRIERNAKARERRLRIKSESIELNAEVANETK